MMTPHFNSFAEFLHMGGLGVYVWTCYVLVFGSMFGLILYARHERKKTIAKLTQTAQSTKLTNKQRKQRNT